MRILGMEITRAAPRGGAVTSSGNNDERLWNWTGGGWGTGGWWPLIIREPFSGAWQQNVELAPETLLAYHAIYACITLISNDIGKLEIRLMERDEDGIWLPVSNPAYSPVLRRPNHYQNHIQFTENWIVSKLTRGNTYGLKERDERGVVRRIYILDPENVTPVVTTGGDVYYQLNADNLSGIADWDVDWIAGVEIEGRDWEHQITVPASEMIHDRMNCIFHPLVGTSPIFACALAARHGLALEGNAASFFENGAYPGGILVAPGAISNEAADRLKRQWEEKFSGPNRGRIAVMGDGLKFEQLGLSAADSQLVEQAKFNAEIVCSVFHVPGFMLDVGRIPGYQNIEALLQFYYSQCLQSLIEAYELCMDEGLALPTDYRTELDLDGLLRMDSAALMSMLKEGVTGGLLAPNEGRRRLNLRPVLGGQTPYLQQQNYSLSALDARDRTGAAPTTITPPAAPAPPAASNPPDEPVPAQNAVSVEDMLRLGREGLVREALAPTDGARTP
ncbi:phage portal protein [Paraburkholderia adhaesiva]|uniref:phage portal protein n=1 Tax=Paraburkholderia adhaesiva TaxID=2883244 RepID=UPI001F2CEE53|nr:phage portal protein [Paraburkholderia adhaesiva]